MVRHKERAVGNSAICTVDTAFEIPRQLRTIAGDVCARRDELRSIEAGFRFTRGSTRQRQGFRQG
jgi:hypothetical protein